MYKLFVALVLLQVCWGEHASHRSRHMQRKEDIQRDTVLRERSDAKYESPTIVEEPYGTFTIPKIQKKTGNWVPGMENPGDIQGDIVPPPKLKKKKEDDEQFDDEMEGKEVIKEDIIAPKKTLSSLGELFDMVKEDGEDTVVMTKRSSKLGAYWPGGVVPYVIGNVNSKYITLIDDAIADLKKYTCVVFRRKRSSDKEYAVFEDRGPKTGCSSPIGYPPAQWNGDSRYSVPRVNNINLESSECGTHGVVLHEMLHTIGLHHEQVRYDRNQFITILRENVKEDAFEANFKKITSADKDKWTNFGTDYDYYSIMQYGAYFFSKAPNVKITIKTNDPKYQWLIGRMKHMSPVDAYQINKMYPCYGKAKPPQFQCVDKRDRCDLVLKANKCKNVYDICCKSCREGIKCEDYEKSCRDVAKRGGCNPGNGNKKFTDQQCCKTCKDVGPLYRSCFDKYSSCTTNVADGGYCRSRNNRLKCCASCKALGPTKCEDYPQRGASSCRDLAMRGNCNSGSANKEYMDEKCCKTCKDYGRKYKTCINKYSNCKRLAKENTYGYCSSPTGVPGAGAVDCCASCKERGPVKCEDKQSRWKKPSCRTLARRGACNSGNGDKRYMDQSCCKTCKDYGWRYKYCIDKYNNCDMLARENRYGYCGRRSGRNAGGKDCCASCKDR